MNNLSRASRKCMAVVLNDYMQVPYERAKRGKAKGGSKTLALLIPPLSGRICSFTPSNGPFAR